jgi:hypothetical protein
MVTIFLLCRPRFSWTFCLTLLYCALPNIAGAQLSGTYHSARGTTVTYEYQNPGLPTTTLPADITVTFSGDDPTLLTAIIHQPIIGDVPGDNHNFGIVNSFPLVVTGTSTDGRDFEGELIDNSQYFFDWQFDPVNGGALKWTGWVSWIGGRIEVSTLDAGALLVPSVPGDYNQNGVVDAADYVVWRSELEDGGAGRADGNQDGDIDAADYDLWKANFGRAAAGSSITVSATPEPTSVLSLLLGILPIMIGRRTMAAQRNAIRRPIGGHSRSQSFVL